MGNKYSLNFLKSRKELKLLNGLLCFQFKRCKWVLNYLKIEWYCGIKSFLSFQISPFISLCILDAYQRFKVLTMFSEISSYCFIFQYIFRIIFTSDKVFYFSQINTFIACLLSKIYLQSERKAWFYLAQNLRFFYFKYILFFI